MLLVASRAPGAAAPDFDAAHRETMEILAAFIQVNTSNPPGNESRGAEFLKQHFDRAGIPSEIIEGAPGRGSIVARLKGNGRKQPLLLMGHIDVVGVERSRWSVDPFVGTVKDGYLYGRGAADDKGMVAVCLEVMLQLHRLKIPLQRDVIFLAEAGEESFTTGVGIDHLVEKHWDKIACEFALNEGGAIHERNGKVEYVGVATTEKVPRPILLSAKGTSGHGSRPLPDNVVVRLATAVARIGNWQPPMRLNETTRAFFAGMAKLRPGPEGVLYGHLEDPIIGAMAQEQIRRMHPSFNAMLRTTISPTIFNAGFRINVIPGDALAQLDVRILPDENVDQFVAELKRLVHDLSVEVVPAEARRKPTPPSRLDTEMYRALARAGEKVFPGAPALPVMVQGATDSAQLREKGVQVYGLGSVRSDDDTARVHGNDERVSIAGMRKFLEFIWSAVIAVAAAEPGRP